ncbi:helix-turn-helix domain-containing protein [Paenibacillus sp.]|uniref:helix-turn-helix domain-containing protein n=1 Tax=Paenibacillus sp. TaxID=58172 RepID=UPI002D26EABE|nr:helix-turn-helix domain-containing protein [Paenibacillus sp.]HZG56678.1 helix-turn-helix domain-containing protein [Paenibacillus sp.]
MERLYTLKEVAEVLSLSYATVYRMVNDGTLPSTKVGGSIRVAQESLRKFILGNSKGGN